MIETKYYALGFLIYIIYMIYTFNVYSKKQEMTKVLILFTIYFYYTILAAYIINLVDSNATFFEKVVQIGIYIIAGGLILFYHYENNIKINDNKMVNFKSKN